MAFFIDFFSLDGHAYRPMVLALANLPEEVKRELRVLE